MLLFGGAAALDHAEIGHGIGQRAADDIEPPVQFLLVQVRQQAAERRSELLETWP